MMTLDRLAIDEVGIPALVLMEVAGRAVADAAEALFNEDRRPVFAVAGTGNNGADAVVAARHLADRGVPVSVAVVGAEDRLTTEAQQQLSIAERLGIDAAIVAAEAAGTEPRLVEGLRRAGTVVDGLFGTGLTRPLEGGLCALVDMISARDDLSVVAVDIPSGVDADTGQVLTTAVRADVTVTFQYPKVGHVLYPGRGLAGVLTIADIGIPRSLLPRIDPQTHIISTTRLRQAFVPRSPDSHKGTYGHLLVVAGAPDRPGAALLAGRAALRAGAGLVTVGSDAETIRRVAPSLDALMGLSLGLHRPGPDAIVDALATRTALAIGPSLDPDPRTLAMLKAVLLETRVPTVVDAGALTALGADLGWLRRRKAATVLTPHPKEMGILLGLDTTAVQQNRLSAAQRASEASGAHVVLKGASTVVAHPDGRAAVAVAGNAGMSTGGTGDVLTGVIGSLLAQGVAPDVAAEAGVLVHALAGDRAADHRGEAGLTAPDLIEHLTDVVREFVEEAE